MSSHLFQRKLGTPLKLIRDGRLVESVPPSLTRHFSGDLPPAHVQYKASYSLRTFARGEWRWPCFLAPLSRCLGHLERAEMQRME